MKLFLSFFALLVICLSTIAQSISGNVAEATEFNSLDFANVEIYKDNKLVASLITDRNGNYNTNLLDTGTYVVNVMYSGYETFVQEINVTGDSVNDVKLLDDPDAKKRQRELLKELESEAESVGEINVMSFDYSVADEDKGMVSFMPKSSMAEVDYTEGGLYADGYFKLSETEIYTEEAFSNGLTAGEVNDFSKWNQWEDLNKNELNYFQGTWKMAPDGRYMVQLMNEDKIPLANADVKLISENEEVLYHSRSDNTGKAELWETIRFPLDSVTPAVKRIDITYGELSKSIKSPKLFKEGINTTVLKADCEASNTVDIAFVVDATGSMQDEIDYLKLDINDVIYQAKQMNDKLTMRFGSVFYRDYGDAYLTKHKDFTKVLSSSSAFIEEQHADGGGDGPEAVEDALELAIDSLSWSDEARTRLLFLVLDAPPHNNSMIQKKLRALSEKAAAKGIRIVTIAGSGIEKSAEYLMRSIALATNGSYIFLTDHSGIGGSHIAPSTDEYELKLLNELLTDLIKSYTYIPSCDEEVPNLDLYEEMPDSIVSFKEPLDSLLVIEPSDSLLVDEPIDDPSEPLDPNEPTNPVDPFENIEWKYYPNPTYGPLTIEVSEAVEMLFLTDMSGKILREIPMNGNLMTQTNLDGLPMGMYFLRYPIGKKWLSGKILLMR
ncbi:MAG: carboxypeptidase regulatory-like domain-containing protein [Flavobacteriales bacterium]